MENNKVEELTSKEDENKQKERVNSVKLMFAVVGGLLMILLIAVTIIFIVG